jgi:hypothetical protein
MRVTLVNAGTTIGATSNPTLTIELAKCKFSTHERGQGNDEIVTQKVAFKAHYSVDDTSMVEVTLRNTVASY